MRLVLASMTYNLSDLLAALSAQDNAQAARAALVPYWIGALASASTLVLNGIGLLFLWRQLRANQAALTAASDNARAAADAAKIAHESSRPWIKLTASQAHMYFNPSNLDEVGCQVNVLYENIGHTPAVQVTFAYKPVATGFGHHVDWADEFENLTPHGPALAQTLFPGDKFEGGRSTNFPFPRLPDENHVSFRVVAKVTYKSHAEGEVLSTSLLLQLQQTDPPTMNHRMYRGMGQITCLVIPLGDETPDPV